MLELKNIQLVWTGDNQSLWEHLRMSLPMLMNLRLKWNGLLWYRCWWLWL